MNVQQRNFDAAGLAVFDGDGVAFDAEQFAAQFASAALPTSGNDDVSPHARPSWRQSLARG